MSLVPSILLAALIQVESGGNNVARGDYVNGRPTTFGCLQISHAVIEDVNRHTGTRFTINHADEQGYARFILQAYLAIYATPARLGRTPTMRDMARIWNGGPDGWRKPETLPYWHKVQREMNRLSPARLPIDGTNNSNRSNRVGATSHGERVATDVAEPKDPPTIRRRLRQPSRPVGTGIRAGD